MGLVAETLLAVMPPNPKNFNVNDVWVVKIMGGNLGGSTVVRSIVFGGEPEGTPDSSCKQRLLNLSLSW